MIVPASKSALLELTAPTKMEAPSALPDFLRRVGQLDREFVVYDDGWRGWTYSYSDVARMAGAFASKLRAHGLRKGDCVVIWSESRPGWIAALWGCLIEGVVLVPVEPQASSGLLGRIEQQVKPRVILLGDLVTGVDATSTIPVWLLRDIEADVTHLTLTPILLSAGETAEIIFTSGTTAEPKGVIMTHRNLAACLQPLEEQLAPYRKYFRLLKPIRVLNLLPMSHMFGQVVALFVVPLIPGSVVFLDSTSPGEIARQIQLRRICALVSVPKVLEVLRNHILHRFPETRDAATRSGNRAEHWWRYRSVHRLFGWRFCCFSLAVPPSRPKLNSSGRVWDSSCPKDMD